MAKKTLDLSLFALLSLSKKDSGGESEEREKWERGITGNKLHSV